MISGGLPSEFLWKKYHDLLQYFACPGNFTIMVSSWKESKSRSLAHDLKKEPFRRECVSGKMRLCVAYLLHWAKVFFGKKSARFVETRPQSQEPKMTTGAHGHRLVACCGLAPWFQMDRGQNVKVRFHLEENVGPSWWFEEDNKIFSWQPKWPC